MMAETLFLPLVWGLGRNELRIGRKKISPRGNTNVVKTEEGRKKKKSKRITGQEERS
jgi:hypothetical protein